VPHTPPVSGFTPRFPQVPLEVIHEAPAKPNGRPPLLFLHGMCQGAWVWSERWMPAAAARGWDTYALSYRGHGNSGGNEAHRWTPLAAYVQDVLTTLPTLPAPPILIGHSMGGVVMVRALQHYTAPAAVYMAPATYRGITGIVPGLWRKAPGDVIRSMLTLPVTPRPEHLVTDRVPRADSERWARMSRPGTPRNTLDLQWPTRISAKQIPSLLLAPAKDYLIPMSEFEYNARQNNSAMRVYPDAGHSLMLEVEWEQALDDTLAWLEATLDKRPAP
jgi:pimeloyl-ACP methyl ester carboxylesterase